MKEEHVISDSQEILKLFQNLRAQKSEIILRNVLDEYTATISKTTDVSIALFFKGNIPEQVKEIDLSSTVGNTVYFAKCRVINVSHSEITIAYPVEIEKGIKRKYHRVEVKNEIFVKFNVISNVEDKFNPNNPNKKLPQQFVNIYKELLEPIPNIKRILPLLAQELKKKAPLFEIKLYQDANDKSKRIEILKKYKQTIFISNVKDSKAYIKDIQSNDAISYLPYIKELKDKGMEAQNIKLQLVEIMKEDIKSTAKSYICSPIKLFSNAIGHIFLGLPDGNPYVFRDQDIYFIQIACDIISEALAKVRLHQLDTGDEYDVSVDDLSAGGLSISFEDKFILSHLEEGTKIRIGIKIGEKEINTVGSIVRIDSDEESGSAGVAIKFNEIRWVDQDFIDTFVNRKIGMMNMQKNQS